MLKDERDAIIIEAERSSLIRGGSVSASVHGGAGASRPGIYTERKFVAS